MARTTPVYVATAVRCRFRFECTNVRHGRVAIYFACQPLDSITLIAVTSNRRDRLFAKVCGQCNSSGAVRPYHAQQSSARTQFP
jgi:hypothetical protein